MNGLYGQLAARSVEVDFHTDEESAYNPSVPIPITKPVKEADMKKRSAMNNVAQVREITTPILALLKDSLQRLQAGLNGMTGVCVAKNVVVEFLTEEENVFHQNVPTLTVDTTDVLVVDMKRNSAINNVVQVS